MAGKTYKQNTQAHKIFFKDTAFKSVYFKDYEVFSSDYNVFYHVDADNVVVQEIDEGSDIIAQAPTASKSGWTFLGWRIDTSPVSSVLSSLIATADGMHVYAVFQQTITVTLSGGSSVIRNTGIRYYNNSNTADPSITLGYASMSGWTLVGYRRDTSPTSSTSYQPGRSYTFTADITLYAVFGLRVYLYVTSKEVQSSYPGMRYYNSGHYANPTIRVADPSYSIATFKGYSSSSTSTTIVNPTLSTGITITANTYRYAVWQFHDATLYSGEIYREIYVQWGQEGPFYLPDIMTLDGRHYASLQVTAKAFIDCGEWKTATSANISMYPSPELRGTGWNMNYDPGFRFDGGPCAGGATATVSVPVPANATASYKLQAVARGDVYNYSGGPAAWVRIYTVVGIGKIAVW